MAAAVGECLMNKKTGVLFQKRADRVIPGLRVAENNSQKRTGEGAGTG